MIRKNYYILLFILFLHLEIAQSQNIVDKDGSQLWFSNMQLSADAAISCPTSICMNEQSKTFDIVSFELTNGLQNLYGKQIAVSKKINAGCLLVGTTKQQNISASLTAEEMKKIGNDGFVIRTDISRKTTIITANTEIGVLYATYHYLRMLQTTTKPLTSINVVEVPAYQRRLLNHWDNLNGSVERGYAGKSIWKWDDLPSKISPRYKEYARANASIGINGTVLNNVNASPEVLTSEYIQKTKIIADQLRPYGIKVYLAINFSSPKEIGKLATSDPLDQNVRNWWNKKAKEIYALIPDFGGFLVKANSEGLPGPQDFGRTHVDGANMLAEALEPFGGIVMWRAFVYNASGEDRAKQAYNEFMPFDGKFKRNVIVQVKNGPVDFQPREPFSPLFGAMKQTTLMPELQITQEYLGFSNHLAYLGTMYKEFLDADTYTQGRHSTVARMTDGSVSNDSITAIAGVANIGDSTNWCGHHLAQSNWYVFGRLAWNHQLSAKEIAEEWIQQTFSHNRFFIELLVNMMMESRQAVVNYMTPLGLHHLMGWSHHHGPEPWCVIPNARPDWLPSYYHNADSVGIGFNRSSTGSGATAQYAEPLKSLYDNPELCPEGYLLWFHHLPWDYVMPNGRILWDELCHRYSYGVQQARMFQQNWDMLDNIIDKKRFTDIQQKFAIQTKEAIWWRDACLLYFQTFSRRKIPLELEKPIHNLNELKKIKFDLEPHS